MISDDERREVARKLRERTKKPMGKSMQRMFTETLGIYAHHISWMNPDKATNRWAVCRDIDLCGECLKSFKRWLKGKEEKGEER